LPSGAKWISVLDYSFRPSPNSLPTRTTFPPRMCTSMSLELPKGLPFSSRSVATYFLVWASKTSGV
jgi:hypothetical protein